MRRNRARGSSWISTRIAAAADIAAGRTTRMTKQEALAAIKRR